jgi:hypothetical protein
MAEVQGLSTGNIMRRFEKTIQRFEGILHRTTDALGDIQSRQISRMRSVYDAQQSTLSWRTWSTALLTVGGGAAGIYHGTLPTAPQPPAVDRYQVERLWSKLAAEGLPKVGEIVGGILDGSSLTERKEQDTVNAEMQQTNNAFSRLASISQAYQNAMQRHQQQVDEARRLS